MTGAELRQWRKHWLFSRVELATRLQVHLNTIGFWERDERHIPDFLPLALETLERRQVADWGERAQGIPANGTDQTEGRSDQPAGSRPEDFIDTSLKARPGEAVFDLRDELVTDQPAQHHAELA